MKKAAVELARLFPGAVRCDVPLSSISRWRIGGNADILVSPRSIDELSHLRGWLYSCGLPSVVIGATSNLLFADEGLRAVVIQIGCGLSSVTIRGSRVNAEAGTWVPGLARRAMMAGLTGIEHTCGIPGTLGGLVCMNGGSQRKGIGSHVVSVVSVDVRGERVERNQQACGFAYRTSAFQSSDEIISSVELELEAGADHRVQRREMLDIMRSRRSKFPQKLPNCGSVFVSNPAMYAQYGPPGKVIEAQGLKGHTVGDAFVSHEHANFIINGGQARAADVLALIALVKDQVARATGYSMAVEARYVTPVGTIKEI
ncbi:UDP-N-acetylmuramate dehydrogenase [Luteimonas sp. S4-F44]|uniref:UDP-N-acetylmuramate dehydrogenase n=1 Tax=Luteimonas sp. S4-F44 TaxID=2925842 RepID=UPI001F53A10B|nr:UDP-N-acetylmuramate dehydrogenase [Luteimonas sp. S4-F44]UNK42217.1 UDP-N-acetylmuramate dehydrogenase [Luteimonas sp. S4-F44]